MTKKPKTFLLPLTARAALNARLLRAAATANAQPQHHRVAFRIARAADVSLAEQLLVQQLRQAHAPLFAEKTDFVVDFSKQREIAEAVDGCDGVVVSTALSDPNALDVDMNLVHAAKESGSVKDVLKVSCPQGFLGEKSAVAVGAQHWHVEQRIKELKFEGIVRFVRPNMMMDVLLQGKLFEMICGRSLSVSVKNGRVAFVHPQDVAEVLSVLLVKPANAMGIPEQYAVTGPEALSYQNVADQLSEGIGQRVTYTHFPLWAVQPSMWIRGERPEAITNEIQTAKAIEAGAEREVSTTVEDVLSKQPRSFQQFVKEHEDAWPLRAYKE